MTRIEIVSDTKLLHENMQGMSSPKLEQPELDRETQDRVIEIVNEFLPPILHHEHSHFSIRNMSVVQLSTGR